MERYPYTGYDEYKKAQLDANFQKLDKVWVVRQEIELAAQYIRQHISNPSFGICHGTRNGLEILWFRELLGIDVIGTEISPTASQFPHTLQWDFHDIREDWIGQADFIYSNSFDHTYDPSYCLDQWMRCLKPRGICIIEWNEDNLHASRWDPFGATIKELEKLILKKYRIRDRWICRPEDFTDTAPKGEARESLNWKINRHLYMIGHRGNHSFQKILSWLQKLLSPEREKSCPRSGAFPRADSST
jgi:hypothetical protein